MLLVTNARSVKFDLQVREQTVPVAASNHLELLRQLLMLSDEVLFVSPFLLEDFRHCFGDFTVQNSRIELITSVPSHGEEQLTQPGRIQSFGEIVQEYTGHWPVIGIDLQLHSKVYVFYAAGSPFAGIVTSANLTRSGLSKNHETGIILFDVSALTDLVTELRSGLDYVNLSRYQVGRLCAAADTLAQHSRIDMSSDVGLGNILNNYCTPSEENKNITLRTGAKYYIKVSGVTGRPILPEARRPFDEPQRKLSFAKKPTKIQLGDCLLDVAVGGKCFLGYYSCASAVIEWSAEEQSRNEDRKRWPFYVHGNNLSLHYGKQWFDRPLMYNDVIRRFKNNNPSIAVTVAGKDHFLPAIQLGHSWVPVTKEFGEFVRGEIDKWQP